MGWSSGTEYFDLAVRVALAHAAHDYDREVQLSIVREVYNDVAFRYSDWDTQDESDYFDLLFDVMVENGERDPRCPVCNGTNVYEGECEGDCYEARNS